MNQELRDILLYYYKHRDIIEPRNKETHLYQVSDKNGLWIKKDKNVLAILSPHRIEWNGRPLTSHDPNAFAVFQEFVKSVHLRHQDDVASIVVDREQQTRKEDEISRPEQYFDVMEQQTQIAREQESEDLWDNIFKRVIKEKKQLTSGETKRLDKIFQEMSKSREQSKLFLKHVSKWMRKDPVATRRFLEDILPVGYFTRSVHKHRNWVVDYLRHWMSSVSTKEFERQLSAYVKDSSPSSTPVVKSFIDVSSIVDKLTKKIYEQRDTTQTMENLFINLYKLIQPIDDSVHYKYTADMIHEEMIHELLRTTSQDDCKEYVVEAMEYLRPGKYMTKHDFIRLYQVLLDMNGCKKTQQTLFSIAKFLWTQQFRQKCKEKKVPMVSTKDIFQILARFETPYKTLGKLTPYYHQIRNIFTILGWIHS